MITAVLDTTVLIHLLRRHPAALEWLAGQSALFGVSSITWLEVLTGTPNKRAQAETLELLQQFTLVYLTSDDQQWALEKMETLRFNAGVGMMDCLIASVCARLALPIYTHNRKDFLKLLPEQQVIQPY